MKNIAIIKLAITSISVIALSYSFTASADISVYQNKNGTTLLSNTVFKDNSSILKKIRTIKSKQKTENQPEENNNTAPSDTAEKTTLSKVSVATATTATTATAVTNKDTISAVVQGKTLTIRSCNHNAGAICSVRWGGKEFIDDYDHGRQLQSASSFNGLGEDFNPTEAGGSVFHYGVNPSDGKSVLLGRRTTDTVLETYSQMAFWNPVNGVRTSNHTLNKRVTIGYDGLDNVLEYLTQFNIPDDESHTHGVFEAVTAYLPVEFSTFWTYNDELEDVTPLKPSSYEDIREQHLPVIASTADQQYALGVYSPDSPQPSYPDIGYGGFLLDGTPKWNNVFRISNPEGSLHFRSYVVIGTLESVKQSMISLHDKF